MFLAKITGSDGATVYVDPMAVAAITPVADQNGRVLGLAALVTTGGPITIRADLDELAGVIDQLRRRIVAAMNGEGDAPAALKPAAAGPKLVKG